MDRNLDQSYTSVKFEPRLSPKVWGFYAVDVKSGSRSGPARQVVLAVSRASSIKVAQQDDRSPCTFIGRESISAEWRPRSSYPAPPFCFQNSASWPSIPRSMMLMCCRHRSDASRRSTPWTIVGVTYSFSPWLALAQFRSCIIHSQRPGNHV